jgi:hypothetical protein
MWSFSSTAEGRRYHIHILYSECFAMLVSSHEFVGVLWGVTRIEFAARVVFGGMVRIEF